MKTWSITIVLFSPPTRQVQHVAGRVEIRFVPWEITKCRKHLLKLADIFQVIMFYDLTITANAKSFCVKISSTFVCSWAWNFISHSLKLETMIWTGETVLPKKTVKSPIFIEVYFRVIEAVALTTLVCRESFRRLGWLEGSTKCLTSTGGKLRQFSRFIQRVTSCNLGHDLFLI